MATKKIQLYGLHGNGKFALVDSNDFEELSKYRWHAKIYKDKFIYAVTGKIKMHRMIMLPESGKVVDYINHDTLDNRRSNLRICTYAENSRNMRRTKPNTAGFKGVYFVKNRPKSWWAMIGFNGKHIGLGMYNTPAEAAAIYNEAAKKYYGEFAYLNEIGG